MEKRMMPVMAVPPEYQMYYQQQHQQHQHDRQSPYQHQHQHQHRQFHPENEYEYVRREHGYDFMPPSQYVPSRSLSEDSEEETADPPIRIEVPGSDISESVRDSSVYEMDYDPIKERRRKTHVVRGKPVKLKKQYRRSQPLQALPEHYQDDDFMEQRENQQLRRSSSRRELEEEDARQVGRSRSRGGRGGVNSSFYTRETQKTKQRHRRAGSISQVIVTPGAPDEAVHMTKSHKRQSPLPAAHAYDHLNQPRPDYRSRRVSGYGDENRYVDDEVEEIRQVPTAFSYHSDDSTEDNGSNLSRYDIEKKEEEYRKLVGRNRSRKSRSPSEMARQRSYDNQRRSDVPSDLESFTTPAYRSRSRGRDPNSVSGRLIDAPREQRSDNHISRRLSHSKDVRDSIEGIEVPLGMQPRARSATRDLAVDGAYSNKPYAEDRPMEHGCYVEDARLLKQDLKQRKKLEAKERQEIAKPKGIFGRIKDSVRGEKPSREMLENAWSQELREKGSLFEKEPPSMESDLSPHPPHQQYDARAPYPYDNAYYEQPFVRQGSRPLPPGAVPPPLAHPRRDSPYDPRFVPPPDFAYGGRDPDVRYAHPSGKPFQSSRPVTPTLRANPDHRQRHVPLATSMSKHYRSQHQKLGMRSGNRGNQSPRGLQFDPTLASPVPRNKGIVGCY